MRTVRLPDIDLAVADEGRGPPLVLLHAFPLTHAVWQDQIVALAATWRVLAPDLRGFGRSGVTPGRVTVEQLADDVAAMLDVLGVAEPAVVAGLSMGGYVALAFWQALSFVDDSQDRDRLMLTENQLRASLSQVRAVNQTLDAVGRELVVLAPDSFEAARIVNEYKIKVGPVQPAK